MDRRATTIGVGLLASLAGLASAGCGFQSVDAPRQQAVARPNQGTTSLPSAVRPFLPGETILVAAVELPHDATTVAEPEQSVATIVLPSQVAELDDPSRSKPGSLTFKPAPAAKSTQTVQPTARLPLGDDAQSTSEIRLAPHAGAKPPSESAKIVTKNDAAASTGLKFSIGAEPATDLVKQSPTPAKSSIRIEPTLVADAIAAAPPATKKQPEPVAAAKADPPAVDLVEVAPPAAVHSVDESAKAPTPAPTMVAAPAVPLPKSEIKPLPSATQLGAEIATPQTKVVIVDAEPTRETVVPSTKSPKAAEVVIKAKPPKAAVTATDKKNVAPADAAKNAAKATQPKPVDAKASPSAIATKAAPTKSKPVVEAPCEAASRIKPTAKPNLAEVAEVKTEKPSVQPVAPRVAEPAKLPVETLAEKPMAPPAEPAKVAVPDSDAPQQVAASPPAAKTVEPEAELPEWADAKPSELVAAPEAGPRQIGTPKASPAMLPQHNASLAMADMTVVIKEADSHVRHGLELLRRGGLYSARSEFSTALRMIAYSKDARHNSRDFSNALAVGLLALKESSDFSRTDLSASGVSNLVGKHNTPVLKGTDVTNMPSILAAQRYYAFAQDQLTFAVEGDAVGSMALFGMGKAMITPTPGGRQLDSTGPALVLFQSAVAANPKNARAANELGVLLAENGQFEAARELLHRSAEISQQPEVWKNLAAVNARLGDRSLAALAQERATAASQAPGGTAGLAVQWLDAAQFARALPASDNLGPTAPPIQPQPESVEPAAKGKSTARKGLGDLLPLRR